MAKKRGRQHPPGEVKWTKTQRRFIVEQSARLTDAQIAQVLTRVLGRVVTTKAVTHIRQADS